MALRLVTPPAETPVSLAEAKAHLRVDHSDDDAYIESLILAATTYLDGWNGVLGRAIVSQEWELVLDAFPCGTAIEIPLGPLQAVSRVAYDDEDGDEVTLDAGEYYVDAVSRPGWVVLNSDSAWPTTIDAINAVRVTFTAGYDDVPQALRHGVLMLVSHFYENRENFVPGSIAVLPYAVDALIAGYRRVEV